MTALAAGLAAWRAANALAFDCRFLVYEGNRIQCPECSKLAPLLHQVDGVGLRCTNCAKRVLGVMHL